MVGHDEVPVEASAVGPSGLQHSTGMMATITMGMVGDPPEYTGACRRKVISSVPNSQLVQPSPNLFFAVTGWWYAKSHTKLIMYVSESQDPSLYRVLTSFSCES